ncbi:MAG: hypothetical protein M1829_003510 [Trizodia sp. TS-e1964]|nr:MAG: hypothetical protein M1829_003510 [Trizodia sp. TS-e1964]
MSVIVRERERERDWEEEAYRAPPRGYQSVRRYRVSRQSDDTASSYDTSYGRDGAYERERHFERPERSERHFTVSTEIRDRPEREYQYARERPWERESVYEYDRELREPHRSPYELERYSRSTEYFSRPEAPAPPPAPIVIRQEPQPIYIQEAPRAPIIIPREETHYELVQRSEVDDRREIARREPESRHDEFYYSERKDYDRHGRRSRDDSYYYERDGRSDNGSYSDDELVVIRRTEDDGDSGVANRRHLAEGALAGAGTALILNHHRKKQGEDTHGVRDTLGGAAIGALGAGIVDRVQNRYREGEYDSYHRRSRSKSHNKEIAGVGLGAAAAIAAAAIYAKSKNDRRSDHRSRSRQRRHSVSGSGRRTRYDSDARSRSRHRRRDDGEEHIKHDKEHRNKRIAAVGAGTAAVAALVERRHSKSRDRSGRSRSRSRIRQGIPVALAGLGGAAVAGLYEGTQAKKEDKKRKEERRRSRSNTRKSSSNSYTRSRSIAYSDGPDSDRLIEYGGAPVPVYGSRADSHGRSAMGDRKRSFDTAPEVLAGAAAGYGAARAATFAHPPRERSFSHARNDRDISPDSSISSADERHRNSRHRRHSNSGKVRGLAEAGLAAGAVGLAAHELGQRREHKRAERERRRHEDEYAGNDFPHEHGSESSYSSPGIPPAGYPPQNYYPQTNNFPPPPNVAPPPPVQAPPPPMTPNYNPRDYAQQPVPQPPPPPPPVPMPEEPHHEDRDSFDYPTDPLPPGRAQTEPPYSGFGGRRDVDNVSPQPQATPEDRLRASFPPPSSIPIPPHNKSVQFNLTPEPPTPDEHPRSRIEDWVETSSQPGAHNSNRPGPRDNITHSDGSLSDDSDSTINLPDRFDSSGQPKDSSYGRRPRSSSEPFGILAETLEELFSGGRGSASKIFRSLGREIGISGSDGGASRDRKSRSGKRRPRPSDGDRDWDRRRRG